MYNFTSSCYVHFKKVANFCRDNEKEPWDKCYNKQHHKFNNSNRKREVGEECSGFRGMQGLPLGFGGWVARRSRALSLLLFEFPTKKKKVQQQKNKLELQATCLPAKHVTSSYKKNTWG